MTATTLAWPQELEDALERQPDTAYITASRAWNHLPSHPLEGNVKSPSQHPRAWLALCLQAPAKHTNVAKVFNVLCSSGDARELFPTLRAAIDHPQDPAASPSALTSGNVQTMPGNLKLLLRCCAKKAAESETARRLAKCIVCALSRHLSLDQASKSEAVLKLLRFGLTVDSGSGTRSGLLLLEPLRRLCVLMAGRDAEFGAVVHGDSGSHRTWPAALVQCAALVADAQTSAREYCPLQASAVHELLSESRCYRGGGGLDDGHAPCEEVGARPIHSGLASWLRSVLAKHLRPPGEGSGSDPGRYDWAPPGEYLASAASYYALRRAAHSAVGACAGVADGGVEPCGADHEAAQALLTSTHGESGELLCACVALLGGRRERGEGGAAADAALASSVRLLGLVLGSEGWGGDSGGRGGGAGEGGSSTHHGRIAPAGGSTSASGLASPTKTEWAACLDAHVLLLCCHGGATAAAAGRGAIGLATQPAAASALHHPFPSAQLELLAARHWWPSIVAMLRRRDSGYAPACDAWLRRAAQVRLRLAAAMPTRAPSTAPSFARRKRPRPAARVHADGRPGKSRDGVPPGIDDGRSEGLLAARLQAAHRASSLQLPLSVARRALRSSHLYLPALLPLLSATDALTLLHGLAASKAVPQTASLVAAASDAVPSTPVLSLAALSLLHLWYGEPWVGSFRLPPDDPAPCEALELWGADLALCSHSPRLLEAFYLPRPPQAQDVPAAELVQAAASAAAERALLLQAMSHAWLERARQVEIGAGAAERRAALARLLGRLPSALEEREWSGAGGDTLGVAYAELRALAGAELV